jgi:hypothetical protein
MLRLLAVALATAVSAVPKPIHGETNDQNPLGSGAYDHLPIGRYDQNPLGSNPYKGNSGNEGAGLMDSPDTNGNPKTNQGNWTGCGTDRNGVPGAMCALVCECGYQTCPEDKGFLAGDLDYSRCYSHDPVLATDDDACLADVSCCIPSSECPIMCNVNQQAEINMLMLALVDAAIGMDDAAEGDRCETLFALQLHGIAQDEYELCICIKKAIQEVETKQSIVKYNAAVEALNIATCRTTNGETRTVYDITMMCMSTDVVGDPFLAVGEEKIKFFLPPGEMVDLVTWTSPSGRPVAFRGMTFQQKGSSHKNDHKNVQWFRKFELILANTTVMSITSFHAYDPYGMGKASPSSSASPLRRGQLQLGSASENEAMTAAVNLANTEAQSDPGFSEEHKARKTFIGVKLDGRDLFAQPYTMALAQYQSVWATELGLKLTAVQTKEHKIGGELAEKVDVVTDKFKFRIWSSKAGKFFDPKLQVEYAHLNLNMLGPFPANVGGFFAELRGKAPMSSRTSSFLRKVDLPSASAGFGK